MNKKIMLAGVFALAGFIILSAFGGKTKEQQEQEIAAAAMAQLDEYRVQLQEACTVRINEEAQRRFEEYQASLPAPEPAKPGVVKKKKSTATTTKKDPLPQEKPATNPKQDKMQGTPNTEEKQEKMQGTPNTDKKKAKMQGGGN